jgi:predicted O-methyltransferase YrrM
LNNLPKDGILISIEFNETFAKYIQENIVDDRLILITGDALLMKRYLIENGIDKVDSAL